MVQSRPGWPVLTHMIIMIHTLVLCHEKINSDGGLVKLVFGKPKKYFIKCSKSHCRVILLEILICA